MADNRTMAQMLQAPIEGYEDAIVIPPINANISSLKTVNQFVPIVIVYGCLRFCSGGKFLRTDASTTGLGLLKSKSKVSFSEVVLMIQEWCSDAPYSNSSSSY
ncbi:hypothetical protein Tco_0599312 [Tanacetum coccineum]